MNKSVTSTNLIGTYEVIFRVLEVDNITLINDKRHIVDYDGCSSDWCGTLYLCLSLPLPTLHTLFIYQLIFLPSIHVS